MSKAGQLFELPAHLRMGAVPYGCEKDPFARRDELARPHDNTGHPLAIEREAGNRLSGQHWHAALAQRPEKSADETKALPAQILPSALGNKIGIPMRGAVDTTPGDLLLRRHKTRNIVWHQHAVAPIAQFNARDQLGFHGAARCMGAGSLVVIMIGDPSHEPEADPAIRKEFKYLRRTGDKRGQPSLVDSATTEKPHVREYLIVAIGHPGIAGQIVLADPDEPVGMDRATSELRRFFQHDRL